MNRGRPTTYTFGEFQAEGGVTADAGALASGALPTGQTVLRSTGIVEVAGSSRASATLSVVAEPRHISAAVQQVNLGDGSVDTVYVEVE